MKKIARIFLYLFATGILFLAGVFIYIEINKPKILKSITEKLGRDLHVAFTVEDLEMTFFYDFPRFSLTLIDAEIRDSMYSHHHTSLLKAKKIYLKSDLYQIFKGNIIVSSLKLDRAAVFIFKAKNGYSNNCFSDYFDKDGKNGGETKDVNFSIREITFSNVNILVTDSVKEKSYGFEFVNAKSTFIKEKDLVNIRIKGDVYFNSLTFNEEKGGFLSNQNTFADLYLKLNSHEKKLTVAPASVLEIDNSNYYLSGSLDFGKHPYLELKIKNEAVSYIHALAILNKRIRSALKKYRFDGTINTEVLIKHRLDTPGVQPNVNIKAIANDINVYMKEADLRKVNFEGTFTNHYDSTKTTNDANTRINFSNVKGNVEGIPVTGNMYVHGIDDTKIHADLNANFNAKVAQDLVNKNTLQLKGGAVEIKILYDGPVHNLLDSKLGLIATVKGSVKIKNAEVKYLKKDYTFTNVNLFATFDSRDVNLQSVHLTVNNTTVNANGSVGKLIPFILAPDQKLLAKLNVSCPSINLASFISIKPATKIKLTRTEQEFSDAKKAKVASVIDKLIQALEMDILLSADKVMFKNFSAQKTTGVFSIHNDAISVKKFSFFSSEGYFLMDGILTTQNNLSANVSIDKADAKKIFKSFDNFNQKGFKDENIDGKLSANVNYTCKLDENMQIIPSSMRGELDVNFKEGKLIDCFTLGSVGKILLNDDNINYIEFDEIQSHGKLDGYDLGIERLDIVSSYIALTISGIYSFKNNTDLSIQVPLANLKRKKVTSEQLLDNKGTNVYLRAKPGKDGKLSVSYDALKKSRKNR